MASSQHSLTSLQLDLLRAFFEREDGFFLTGGAALVGFYLHHRETEDLDLFTGEKEAFERGVHELAAAAEALGGTMVARQQATGFHRYFVSRGEEAVIVDLVLDHVPQIHIEKAERDGIRLDPPAEILINKLNTIASRCEIRDLVDIMALEGAGFVVEEALGDALSKDGGCTPATLAWVLSELEIPDQAKLPGGIPGAQLREYVERLIRRLRRAAAPEL